MWIETTKSGKRLRDRVVVDGKTYQISVPLEKDTQQARNKAMAALEEKRRDISTPVCEKPLNDILEAYLSRDIRESTRMCQRAALEKLLALFGDVKLRKLTAPLIKRTLLETGKPAATLNNSLMRLKGFLSWCFEYGYIEEDIARKLRKFPEHTKPKAPEELYLEASELSDLLSNLSGMSYYAVKFLALTGLRVGEMSALTMDDVTDKYISVTKSYSVRSGLVTDPKNAHSIRDVYIQPELAELLREYKEWRLVYMLSKGIRTNLLFFTREGTIYAEPNVLYKLQTVSKKYHPHILRHTHTALLAEQGMSLDAIARRLGHVTDRTTREVYFHVTKKQREKDEQELSKIRIL